MPNELDTYLAVLFGTARPRTLVEVRWRTSDGGMRRTFVPVSRLDKAARLIDRMGGERDVFVGVLPRWRRGGRRADVVGDGRTLWVDLDVEDGLRVLEPVDPSPSLVVASGFIRTERWRCAGSLSVQRWRHVANGSHRALRDGRSR